MILTFKSIPLENTDTPIQNKRIFSKRKRKHFNDFLCELFINKHKLVHIYMCTMMLIFGTLTFGLSFVYSEKCIRLVLISNVRMVCMNI